MIWRGLLVAASLLVSPHSYAEAEEAGVTKSDCVILLHGLGRTQRSMKKIAKHLRTEGYAVVNKGYNSRKAPIPALAPIAVETALSGCPAGRTTHVVTHSMGGILLRQYLSTEQIPQLGNVVMLSPPNQGSEVIDRIANWPIYKQVIGPAGRQLGTEASSIPKQLPPANFSLGVIAGTRTVNPVLSTMIEGANDGKVSVASSKVDGMADHLVLPVNHTFMMRDVRILKQISYFLKHKRFDS